MKIKILSLIGLLLMAPELYAKEQVFASEQEEKAYHQLLKEFRCVTCPNQSLADSNAPVAEAMQDEIYRRIKEGQSAPLIKTFLQEHYGDYVLYRPSFKKQNFFLWSAPFIFLAFGILGWFKWRR